MRQWETAAEALQEARELGTPLKGTIKDLDSVEVYTVDPIGTFQEGDSEWVSWDRESFDKLLDMGII